jgi:hypothetical protein
LTTRIQDGKIEEKLKTGANFFAKSHFPYHEGLPFRDYIRVCIYIVRNPLNTLMSRIDHYILEGLESIATPEGKDQIIQNFINYADDKGMDPNGPNKYAGGWNHNVVSWLDINKDIPVYLIRYEDLVDDTIGVITELNEKLELGFTPENIEKGCMLSSFENMKKLEQYEMENEIRGAFYSPVRKKMFQEKNIQFINKGSQRNYQDELSPELIETIKNKLEKGMKLAGYL